MEASSAARAFFPAPTAIAAAPSSVSRRQPPPAACRPVGHTCEVPWAPAQLPSQTALDFLHRSRRSTSPERRRTRALVAGHHRASSVPLFTLVSFLSTPWSFHACPFPQSSSISFGQARRSAAAGAPPSTTLLRFVSGHYFTSGECARPSSPFSLSFPFKSAAPMAESTTAGELPPPRTSAVKKTKSRGRVAKVQLIFQFSRIKSELHFECSYLEFKMSKNCK